jgi:hypothetical protein
MKRDEICRNGCEATAGPAKLKPEPNLWEQVRKITRMRDPEGGTAFREKSAVKAE